MYLYKNGLLPDSFNDMFLLSFVTVTYIHIDNYNTRSKNTFHLPYCWINVRKFSLRFQDSKYLIPLALKFRMPSVVLLCSLKTKVIFLGMSTLKYY